MCSSDLASFDGSPYPGQGCRRRTPAPRHRSGATAPASAGVGSPVRKALTRSGLKTSSCRLQPFDANRGGSVQVDNANQFHGANNPSADSRDSRGGSQMPRLPSLTNLVRSGDHGGRRLAASISQRTSLCRIARNGNSGRRDEATFGADLPLGDARRDAAKTKKPANCGLN